MIRVLLVDDEALALERLQFAFRDIDGAEVVGTASDGIEASDKIASLAPDLVILDIHMPGRTGLAVAAALPAEARPEIIFVTAFEQFAADAFDVEAIDYLIKPVRFDRLRVAIDRARRRRAERAALLDTKPTPPPVAQADDIVVPDPRGDRIVPIASINWIEAAKDYVLLHTDLRSHMIRMTMAELERRLAGTDLVRVHRSAFVRLAAVERIERPGRGAIILHLAGDVPISVGPSYQRSVAEALRNAAPG